MQQGQTLQVKVTQERALYQFPLHIQIQQDDGTKTDITLQIKDKENIFVKEGLKGGYKVLVDPQVKSLFRELK